MHTGRTTKIHFEVITQTEAPRQEGSQTSTHIPQTEEMNTSTNMTQSGGTSTNASSIMNPVSTTGCPKVKNTGTADHIQMTDTTRTTIDTRVTDRQNSHIYRTPDHPRTDTDRVNNRYKCKVLNRETISMQSINVCGLKSKLDIPEFRDTLKVYDISLLCETKLDECDEEYILSLISPLKLKAFFKHRKTLTAWRSGGLCILYKKSLDKYFFCINSN